MKTRNFVCFLPSLHPNVTQATFRTRLPAQKKEKVLCYHNKNRHTSKDNSTFTSFLPLTDRQRTK